MILVVDDDTSVRTTIARALAALGYAVREAPDGRRALESVRDEALSLDILDYVMPGMDGAEVAREIGALDPDLPIVFSTGHAALRVLRAAAGEDVKILEKPFTLAELDELLRERLAEEVLAGRLDFHALPEDDEEAIAAMTHVRGIGRWSAEVYLLFAEGRPDIWPAGDLAVQIEVGRILGLDAKPTEKQTRALAEPWRPHRGAAAVFAWHHRRANPL